MRELHICKNFKYSSKGGVQSWLREYNYLYESTEVFEIESKAQNVTIKSLYLIYILIKVWSARLKYDVLVIHAVPYMPRLKRTMTLFFFALLMMNKTKKIKTIFHTNQIYWHRDNWLKRIYQLLIKSSNKVFVVDKYIGKTLEEIEPEVEYTNLPNPVKPISSEIALIRGPYDIGWAGRITDTVDLKYLEALIAATVDKYNFLLAVAGDKQAKFEQYNNVTIVYNLDYEEMGVNFYKRIKLLINPLRYPGMSRVSIEALLHGLPVAMFFNPFDNISSDLKILKLSGIIDTDQSQLELFIENTMDKEQLKYLKSYFNAERIFSKFRE